MKLQSTDIYLFDYNNVRTHAAVPVIPLVYRKRSKTSFFMWICYSLLALYLWDEGSFDKTRHSSTKANFLEMNMSALPSFLTN